MKKIIFTLAVLFCATASFAQNKAKTTITENKAVKAAQESVSAKFCSFLEQNLPDSAMKLFSETYVNNHHYLRGQLVKAAFQVSAVYKKCKPRYSTYTSKSNTDVIASFYVMPDPPLYGIWLSFNKGDKNPVIVGMKLMDRPLLIHTKVPPPPSK